MTLFLPRHHQMLVVVVVIGFFKRFYYDNPLRSPGFTLDGVVKSPIYRVAAIFHPLNMLPCAAAGLL